MKNRKKIDKKLKNRKISKIKDKFISWRKIGKREKHRQKHTNEDTHTHIHTFTHTETHTHTH